jgi:porin
MGLNRRDATRGTFGHCLTAASLLLGYSCLTPPSSIAQTATAGQPAVSTAATPPPADDHLLGDWGGLRTYLNQNGLDLELSYLGETVGNVTGGAKRSVVYADQIAVQLDVDGGKLIGLPGFGAHLLLINRSGQALSGALGNDQYNANEVFGGGGSVLVHLAYAYVDQKFADGALQISAGRMAAGMFFNNSSEIYCNFLNNGDCPVARALAGGDPAAYNMEPANQWGGLLRANAPAAVYLQVGVFETTPLLGGRSGFDWSTSQDFGTTVPVEIGWEPQLGRDALPAHFKTGFYYDTSTQPDVLYTINGMAIPLSGLPPRGDSGHVGVWAAADAMVVRHPTGPDAGLTVFLNYTHADPNISPFQDLVFVGFEDKGLLAARPADGFGAQVIWARQSSQVQKLQEIQSSLGQPLAFGAPGPQSTETILEAQYAVRVYRGVDLQPDVQYFIRPAATSVYHNALVLALRLSVQF